MLRRQVGRPRPSPATVVPWHRRLVSRHWTVCLPEMPSTLLRAESSPRRLIVAGPTCHPPIGANDYAMMPPRASSTGLPRCGERVRAPAAAAARRSRQGRRDPCVAAPNQGAAASARRSRRAAGGDPQRCPQWTPAGRRGVGVSDHDPDQATRRSTGQHRSVRTPAETAHRQRSTIGAPRSHHAEDQGTSRERIKAVTRRFRWSRP